MSIAAMRRFDLLAHASTKTTVLATLQSLGITHVEDASARLNTGEAVPPPPPGAASDAEVALQTVQTCLAFIDRYVPARGMIEKLREPRLRVSAHEYAETVANFPLKRVAADVRRVEAEVVAARAEITKHEVLLADLRHWQHLDFDCREIRPTERVDLALTVLDTSGLEPMVRELIEIAPCSYVHELERDRPSSYLMLFTLKSDHDAISPILKKYGCRHVDFSEFAGTPRAVSAQLASEMGAVHQALAEAEARAAELGVHRRALLILADRYADCLATERVEAQLLHTEAAYLLSGWVPARDESRLAEAIRDLSPTIALSFADPEPEDEPPVLLENTRGAPFEMISQMYGTPRYDSPDATPWFAPWFAVFFGMCLTDAGYGFVLTGLAGWALMRLRLEGGMRQLASILVFGGACTVVSGAMTGGWFGIAPESLPGPLRALVLLNPMLDGIRAFMLTLGIGVVHVFLGVCIRLLSNWRRGRRIEALCDQGVWLVFIPCAAVLLYDGMFGGDVESVALLQWAKIGAIVSTVLVILTGSREGPIAVRPLMGVAKLYDAMGYFGDVLSYSRLFALGLATGAIGSVTNTIAGQAADGLPWGLGYVVAIIILITGHALNLVINALGAFIHSMRLQFIEFFGKFFEDGGTPFRPFAETRAHIAVESS